MVDLSEEYRTAVTGAGWHVDERRGRLRVGGADATAFLDAIVTADFNAVSPGGGAYTAYLTPQGRMITDFSGYRLADHWLLDVPPGEVSGLLTKFDSLVFAEDVQLSDVTKDLRLVSLVGGRAAEFAAAALGIGVTQLVELPMRSTVDAGGVLVARTDAAEVASFDLFVPVEQVTDTTRRLSDAGAIAISGDALEIFRIEAARPAWGADMTSSTIPLEAGLLDRAISQTKGCYVGQEVIVRVLHRGGGRVAERLMQIEAGGDEAIPRGADIIVGGDVVGRITSSAFSPGRGRWIGLGYVKRDSATVGQPVTIGHVATTITAAAG